MTYRILIFLFCLAFVTSCHEDILDDKASSESTVQVTVPDVYNEISSDIIGFVGDQSGSPIAGALVETYSSSAVTNQYGIFSLLGSDTDQLGTYLTVSKDGFLSHSKLVYPSETGSIISKLLLDEISEDASFENTNGGTVALQSGGTLVFEGQSITQANGSAYNGLVSVSADLGSAIDEDFGIDIYGGFRAKGPDGADKVIAAIGTLDLSVTTVDQLVVIDESTTVSVKWPIPEEFIGRAKEEISVWFFDDQIQKWIEGGTAKKNGSYYEFLVNQAGHFMLGDPYGIVRYCTSVTNDELLPLSNVHYRIQLGGYTVGGGVTGDDGILCSMVPLEEEFEIEFYHATCDDVLKTVTIDPQSEVALGDEVILETEALLRTGIVTCNQIGVENAIIMVTGGNLPQLYVTDQNGDFSFDLDLVICDDVDQYQVIAIGQDGSSPMINQSMNNMTPMKLEVCDLDCGLQVTIEFFKGDYCVSGLYDGMRAIVQGGSGEFEVLWTDGNTTLTTEVPAVGTEICMTLKDQSTGCEVQECITGTLHEALSVSDLLIGNSACQSSTGEIEVAKSGGIGPFTYSWSGPDGYVSIEEQLTNLEAGLYSLTVTDARMCAVQAEVELFDVTTTLQSDISDGCDSKIISIIEGEGNRPFTYQWSNNGSTTSSLEVTTPGVYAVTVTDATNCNRSITFEINAIPDNINFDLNPDCNRFIHAFDNYSPDATYEVINDDGSQYDIVDDAGKLFVSVLDSEYDFQIAAVDSGSGCQSEVNIELPHFYGLSVDDVGSGSVIYSVDGAATCRDCVFGETRVWTADTYEDVSTENQAGSLSTGDYIVVVLSEDESCVIAHQMVSID